MISHIVDQNSSKIATAPVCCYQLSLLFSFFQEGKTMPSNLFMEALRTLRPKEYTAIVLFLLGIALLSNVNASHLNPDLFEGFQNQTSFTLLSSCSLEANAQESLTSFDVQSTRRQKCSHSFYSCFESGRLLPCKVTTVFSLGSTSLANTVDFIGKYTTKLRGDNYESAA